MPTPETLEAFIGMVEAGRHVEAIERWYTEDASMQENGGEPRVGRDVLAANEQRVMDGTAAVVSTCVRPVFVAGDHVVIRWIFEFERKDGRRLRMEELAYQVWRGERIAQEQFFYDPAQLKPSAAG
jgi:ketosteroid isomerase-like protein